MGGRALASASKNGVRVWLGFVDVSREKMTPDHADESSDQAWVAEMQYVRDHNNC